MIRYVVEAEEGGGLLQSSAGVSLTNKETNISDLRYLRLDITITGLKCHTSIRKETLIEIYFYLLRDHLEPLKGT